MIYDKVLTCGTFDLLHIGHILLLDRARAYGDELIVGLSTDKFSKEKKGVEPIYPYLHRLKILSSLRSVNRVYPEINMEWKRQFIINNNVSRFIIGDDWLGKFDDLPCEVIYLPRTKGISTTQIKERIIDGPKEG